LRHNEARAEEGPPTFGRPVGARLAALALGALGLGWLRFRGTPSLLDEALVARGGWDDLGPTPFFATFYVVVNLHHFAMDAVIWRREHAPTRHLVGGSWGWATRRSEAALRTRSSDRSPASAGRSARPATTRHLAHVDTLAPPRATLGVAHLEERFARFGAPRAPRRRRCAPA
jgi:hypothetical protein